MLFSPLTVAIQCFVFGAVLSLAIVLDLRSSLAAEPVEIDGDWVIQGQETRRGERIRLNGNLILPAGSVLTLEDCTLEILGVSSREHLVDWKGGTLVTRRCTVGGHVGENGVPVHTVFHLYEGEWQAESSVSKGARSTSAADG